MNEEPPRDERDQEPKPGKGGERPRDPVESPEEKQEPRPSPHEADRDEIGEAAEALEGDEDVPLPPDE